MTTRAVSVCICLALGLPANFDGRNEPVASVEAIMPVLGVPVTVPADDGYANGAEVTAVQERGVGLLVAT